MRKFLPSEEYRLLKNRKSARLCRKKRKAERGDMQKQIEDLVRENQQLKERLQQSEHNLKESRMALMQKFSENDLTIAISNKIEHPKHETSEFVPINDRDSSI